MFVVTSSSLSTPCDVCMTKTMNAMFGGHDMASLAAWVFTEFAMLSLPHILVLVCTYIRSEEC